MCSTDKQFKELDKIYKELMVAVMEEITEITGCKKPCTYVDYLA